MVLACAPDAKEGKDESEVSIEEAAPKTPEYKDSLKITDSEEGNIDSQEIEAPNESSDDP